MILAIVLAMVGFVLLHNAIPLFKSLAEKAPEVAEGEKPKVDKSSAYVNIAGGVIILIAGIYSMLTAVGGSTEGYWNADFIGMDGFGALIFILVGITYVYLGIMTITGIGAKACGVYCGFVGIFLGLGAIFTIITGEANFATVLFVFCYVMWAILWFLLFFEFAFEKKSLAKPVYILCLVQAFTTGILPSILLLAGVI